MRYLFILLLLAAWGMWESCDDETEVCDQTLSTETRLRFRRDSANTVRDTIMSQVTVFALGRDSIYAKARASSIFLQLSPLADSSAYYLKVDSLSDPDTLLFRYRRTPTFISPGCGFATFYSLDTIIFTQHTLQRVEIHQKEITSTANDTAHISLHFGI